MSRSVRRISLSFRSPRFLLVGVRERFVPHWTHNRPATSSQADETLCQPAFSLLHCDPGREPANTAVAQRWWTFVPTPWFCTCPSPRCSPHARSCDTHRSRTQFPLVRLLLLFFLMSGGCSECFSVSVREGWRPAPHQVQECLSTRLHLSGWMIAARATGEWKSGQFELFRSCFCFVLFFVSLTPAFRIELVAQWQWISK